MQPVTSINTIELFPPLSAALLDVLQGLAADEWQRTTACADWLVKDVAAHLLGGNLGRLSFGRDGLTRTGSGAFPSTWPEQVAFIDQQNAAWVAASRRISGPVLLDFLRITDPQLYAYFKTLPLLEPSRAVVAWAGDTQSPWWFDIAREYTEKWLHQQHIREAVGRPLLDERQWLFPVLDTFVRALPHTYRNVAAAEGTAIAITITGPAGSAWSLVRNHHAWQLLAGSAPDAVATMELDQDTAWRLFTKGISPAAAQSRTHSTGDEALTRPIMQMVSIMA